MMSRKAEKSELSLIQFQITNMHNEHRPESLRYGGFRKRGRGRFPAAWVAVLAALCFPVISRADIGFNIGSATVSPGANVTVPVTVSGFSLATSFQFTLTWDTNVVQYASVGDFGPIGLTSGDFAFEPSAPGILRVAWYDLDATGATMNDGSTLFSITFVAVGIGGQQSPINFSNDPTPIGVSQDFTVASFSITSGAVQISDPAQLCPADSDLNSRIVIGEVTAYGAAWKWGETWPTPPNPIPINYATRVGYLWKNGECYGFDQSQDPPLCWVLQPCPATASAADAQAASLGSGSGAQKPTVVGSSSVVRSVAGATVSVQASPGRSVSVYAVEEDLPAGLTPYGITEGGSWDAVNRKVKWGPFFDNAPRRLAYGLSGFAGHYRLSGVESCDGLNLPTTGAATINLESALRMGGVRTGLSGHSLTFRFPSAVGRQYQIECTEHLPQGPWQVVDGPLAGTGRLIQWTDERSKTGAMQAASAPRFYRVRSSPMRPPSEFDHQPNDKQGNEP